MVSLWAVFILENNVLSIWDELGQTMFSSGSSCYVSHSSSCIKTGTRQIIHASV